LLNRVVNHPREKPKSKTPRRLEYQVFFLE
jgi:hypothetical protein